MTTASQLIEELLGEKAPGDPYDRAKMRIEDLFDRFDGDERKVIQHTLLRLRKIAVAPKVEGLYLAAVDLGLDAVAREAKKKFKAMTGMNPRKL